MEEQTRPKGWMCVRFVLGAQNGKIGKNGFVKKVFLTKTAVFWLILA